MAASPSVWRRVLPFALLGLVLAGLLSYSVAVVALTPARGSSERPAAGPTARLSYGGLGDVLPPATVAAAGRGGGRPADDPLMPAACAGGGSTDPFNAGVRTATARYRLVAGDRVAGDVRVTLAEAPPGPDGDARAYLDGLRPGCAGTGPDGAPFECTGVTVPPRRAPTRPFLCVRTAAGGDTAPTYHVLAASGRYLLRAVLVPPGAQITFPADGPAVRAALGEWLTRLYVHVDRYLPTAFAAS